MKVTVELNEIYSVMEELPDCYEYDSNKLLTRPDLDFIMTRKINGSILSQYGDDIWDYSPYHKGQRAAKFNFKKHIHEQFVDEAKWLLFLVDRVAKQSFKKNLNNYAISTLYYIFSNVIRPICEFAFKHKLEVASVLSVPTLTKKLIHQNINVSGFTNSFQGFINSISRLNYSSTGYGTTLDNESLKLLSDANTLYSQNLNQTPVIPPRLYGLFLNQAWAIINEYEQIRLPFLRLAGTMANWPVEKTLNKNGITKCARKSAMQPFLKNKKLKAIINKYQWESEFTGIGKHSISSYITNLQCTCKDLIHFYSGMRSSEVINLPYHCLFKEEHKNRTHSRLIAYTTKYSGYPAKGSWVTTFEIERVIRVLQDLMTLLATNSKLITSENIEEHKNVLPLFISPKYFVKGHKKNLSEEQIFINATLSSRPILQNSLYNIETFTITEEDITFLEIFEPETEWRTSKYSVGSIWNFTSHQFRRSLAVFASASGLVSIGSIQTQLHHLFTETSYYYANNSENCTFDVSDVNHISKQFSIHEARANFSLMVKDLLFSDEPLYGAAGKQYDKTFSKISDKFLWIKENRAVSERKAQNGEIAYKTTAVGGCSSITPCDKMLTRSFVSCLDCKDASLKLSKIDNVINKQINFLTKLEEGTIEQRYEQSELDKLIILKNKVVV